MTTRLRGLRVAVLVTDGFEQIELTGPREALEDAGARTELVVPGGGEVQGFNHFSPGDRFAADVSLEDADPLSYDALLLPGGVANPDRLRTIPRAVDFVRSFVGDNRPVAAICHGPWLLVEADAVRDRVLTSWPSVRTDIENAGGQWIDREVVVDKTLVTSRKPDDIPAFNRTIVEVFDRESRLSKGAGR